MTDRDRRETIQRLATLAWPLVVNGLLFWLESANNRFWLSRYLGAEGIAVHTTTVTVVGLVQLVFIGIATGTAVMIARSVGAKDGRGLSILASSIALSAIVWIVIAAAIVPLGDPIANALVKKDVSPDAVRTFLVGWVLLAVPLNAIVALLTAAAISTGWTRFALVASLVHLGQTVFLLPVFLGPADLGFIGPGLAVACAGTVNSIVLWRLLRTQAATRMQNNTIDRALLFDRGTWRQIIDIGIPLQLSRALFWIVLIAVVLRVGEAGVATLAGYGIAMVCVEIGGGAAGGFAQAAQILIAQRLGANDKPAARRALRVALGLSWVLPAVAIAIFVAFAPQIASLFSPREDVTGEGVRALRMMAWVLLPAATWQVMLSAFGAARATKRALLLTIVAQAVPLAIIQLWDGERVLGGLVTIFTMYALSLVFYLLLAVKVLWRGAFAETT